MHSVELTQRIGLRIRAERRRRHWSLSALSERTGKALSKSRISNYEQGLRRLGYEEACLLADAFATVSPSWLLCIADAPEPLTDEEATLVLSFRRLDARAQASLLALARAEAGISGRAGSQDP